MSANLTSETSQLNNSLPTHETGTNPAEAKYKIKLCRVCGDRASAFNFNGLTCECCKIFFRRNAASPKSLTCRQKGQCLIDCTTRRACPACRLAKCFAIGMKLRKSDTHKNVLQPVPMSSELKVSQTNEQLRGGEQSEQLEVVSPVFEYPVTSDDLTDRELGLLAELRTALAVFECEHSLPTVGDARTLPDALNLPANYARKIVQFCKAIPVFRSLSAADQILILRPFYVELCLIRFAYYYDQERDAVPMLANESGQQVAYFTFRLFSDQFLRSFFCTLRTKLENDPVIRDLLVAMHLFKHRTGVSCQEILTYQYCIYRRLLRRHLVIKHRGLWSDETETVSLAETNFRALISFLVTSVNDTREHLIQMHRELDRDQLTEVVLEIFNLL